MSDLSSVMKESLEKTFDEIQDREETDLPEKEDDKPEVVDKPEEDHEETDKPEKAEAKPEVVKETAKTTDKVAAPTVTDKTLVNPPSTWRPAAKAEWGKLPEGIRKEIIKREADASRGVTEHKEMAQYGTRLQSTIAPYQAYFKSKNIDPFRAAEDAFNLSYSLATSSPQEKGVILKRIAQQYGADLTVFTQQQNPEQDQLQRVLAPLQQRIDQLERERQNSLSSTQQQNTQSAEQLISEFSSMTDDTGQLKYPYFHDVQGLMGSLLESGLVKSKTLDEAYAIAVKAHPDTRDLVSSAQSANLKEKERVDKAKKNDRLNIQKRAASPAAKAPQGSMRDTIEAAYERLQNA